MTKRERLIFWGLIALAALLRFFTLGDRPFDGDEGVILKIAELPIQELLGVVAVDVHPPLYHLLVHWSISLFGVSEWSVRLVGVLAGIGLVALAQALGSTLRVPGWLLGLLLATSPYLVNLSQDARMYSLLVFLATALWIMAHRIATNRSSSWLDWIVWSLLALAIVYTHHIGWLIVGLMGMVLIWQTTINPPQSLPYRVRDRLFAKGEDRVPLFRKEGLGEILKGMSAVIGILILGYLPILSTTIAQVQGRLGEQSAIAGLGDTVSGVGGGLYRMMAGRTFLDINPGAVVDLVGQNPLAFTTFLFTLLVPIFVLLIGFTGRSVAKAERSWRRQALVVIGWSLLVAILIGSIGSQASRYLSFLAPLLYGFLAIGVVAIWSKSWGKAAIVVVTLTFLAGLTTQYFIQNQAAGDDVYAEQIERQSQPGDIVLLRGAFAGGEGRAFAYYRDKLSRTPGALDGALKNTTNNPLPFSLETVDMLADYDVRKSNLDELRAVDPATKAVELLNQPGIMRVWYFDNSYQLPTLENLPAGYISEVQDLNVTDKEGKQLILTKVTKS